MAQRVLERNWDDYHSYQQTESQAWLGHRRTKDSAGEALTIAKNVVAQVEKITLSHGEPSALGAHEGSLTTSASAPPGR